MAYYAIRQYKEGRKIIYYPKDLALAIPGAVAMGPKDIAMIPESLNGALVCIDEMQELMSKFRSNSTLSLQIMSFFRQVRKKGANVIFTSNDPDGINRALPDQTDLHGLCHMITDERCYRVGYHIPRCTDTVQIRIKDTKGRHGLIPFRKDGRKGFVQNLVGISDVYPFYNTASIADLTEVVGTTKAEILEHKAAQNLGMSWEEFDHQLLEGVIPQLVRAGVASISPKNFAATLKSEMNIPAKGEPLSPEIIGRRLKGFGLQSKRATAGMVYSLPPIDKLTDWQAGLWSPGDDE